MKTERIKSPDGVRKLMAELWAEHTSGNRSGGCRMFMVDLPEPTEEEKRNMALNRTAGKPFVINVQDLTAALERAADKLGGW